MFRGRDVCGDFGQASKVVSRLDGKQNFTSRADGRLGFEGKVPKVREGCLRHDWPTGGEIELMSPFLFVYK